MKRLVISALLLWTTSLLYVHAQENQWREYQPQYHTVQKGETLYSIARKYGLSVDALKKQNGLMDNEIFPSQRLRVAALEPTPTQRYQQQGSQGRNQPYTPPVEDLPITSKPVYPQQPAYDQGPNINRSSPSLETRLAQVLFKQELRTFQRVHSSFHHINSPQRQRSFYLNLQQLMEIGQPRDLIFISLSGNLNVLREDAFNYISDLPGTKIIVIDYSWGDLAVRSRVQNLRYDRNIVVIGSDYVDRRRLNNAWYAQILKQAVSEGLEGAADMNQDRVVQLHELDFFINERVNELSRGMQRAFIQSARQAANISFYLD
ncbi:MAG: LysM peptidoglycan-binding domain-containing protein [Bacteroidota bacterium]